MKYYDMCELSSLEDLITILATSRKPPNLTYHSWLIQLSSPQNKAQIEWLNKNRDFLDAIKGKKEFMSWFIKHILRTMVVNNEYKAHQTTFLMTKGKVKELRAANLAAPYIPDFSSIGLLAVAGLLLLLVSLIFYDFFWVDDSDKPYLIAIRVILRIMVSPKEGNTP